MLGLLLGGAGGTTAGGTTAGGLLVGYWWATGGDIPGGDAVGLAPPWELLPGLAAAPGRA